MNDDKIRGILEELIKKNTPKDKWWSLAGYEEALTAIKKEICERFDKMKGKIPKGKEQHSSFYFREKVRNEAIDECIEEVKK